MRIFALFLLMMVITSCYPDSNNSFQENFDQYLVQQNSKGFPTVGTQIHQARMKKGLSELELADATGLSNTNIVSIEKNKVIPTRDIINSIQEILDTEIVLDAR